MASEPDYQHHARGDGNRQPPRHHQFHDLTDQLDVDHHRHDQRIEAQDGQHIKMSLTTTLPMAMSALPLSTAPTLTAISTPGTEGDDSESHDERADT